MENDKLILVAVTCAVGGALLGVLFAPDKGKNTRKKLVKKKDEYLSEIKKNSDELSQQLKNNTDSVLEKTKNAAQSVLNDVEDYAELTFQELYDLAKDLQIKGYSQMNKSELIKALEN